MITKPINLDTTMLSDNIGVLIITKLNVMRTILGVVLMEIGNCLGLFVRTGDGEW